MAPAYFLKIDGIAGQSRDPEHPGELELDAFTWGETAIPSGAPVAVSFTLPVGTPSPALFAACASGRRIAFAVLTMREGERGDDREQVQQWRFSDIVVAGYATSGSGEAVLDQVSLVAEEVTVLALPVRRSLRLHVVRPDDLLNLEIEAVNLRIDRRGRDPALVVADPERPARLIVIFPPQTIAETAYFEVLPVAIDGEENPDVPPEPAPPVRALDAPGSIGPGPRDSVARVADSSRLVFDVQPGTRIPCTVDGLLDWSALELVVSPIAAIPPKPSDEEIASAPAILPPDPSETALELPYRLVVSPNRGGTWRHRTQPFTSRGRTELWHTRLALRDDQGNVLELTRENGAPLRAIWSPDHAPFDPPDPMAEDPNLGLTAMSPSDRHQIVILTSAFHGYEVEVKIELEFPGPLFEDTRARATAALIPFKITVPHVPEPFFAEFLMLSPLGAWLRSRGEWTPPQQVLPRFPFRPDLRDVFQAAAPRLRALSRGDAELEADLQIRPDIGGIVLEPTKRIGEKLDLSEWVHVAAQGRDHYVRIVYLGELKPFGNEAALIKVTERKFEENGPIVGAYLRQRMFIVVRQPVADFGGDRAMPYKRIRLTTLVTPAIAFPERIDDTERSFWVEVMTSETTKTRFMFHGVGVDWKDEEVDFTVPMMFVSFKETATTLPKAYAAYNDSHDEVTLEARELLVPGQHVTFAEAASTTQNTRLVTDALNFVLDEGGAPKLLKADVRIPQVQELLGKDAATTIRYFQDYVVNGFDAATGVFAEVVKVDPTKLGVDPFAGIEEGTLGVDFRSDKAGGFATPNLGVSTLTRSLGPLAGEAKDAVLDKFDPASFFGDSLAFLFGSFDLAKLLPSSTLGQNAPKMRTAITPDGKRVETTIDWSPVAENLDLVVAEFAKDHGGDTEFEIHGLITKTLEVPAPGDPGITSEFKGDLTNFRIGVLKSVFVNFERFDFVAKSGEKTAVTVDLADPPLEFKGDLEFVEDLRKQIPQGLFGSGSSLDITDDGIRAGFAIGLPPVAVGVFALKDVSLGAGLMLPFTDGKPAFDFNVSRREAPFLLQVSIFGGGGFFHIQLDTAGMKELEAALEFGVTASLDFGVASGSVHMMAGIYFSLVRVEPNNDYKATLTGYLRAGGSLQVLGIVTVSVEFVLSFTYDSVTEKAYGRATLTVEVEVAFFSASVELTVERGFGGQDGDPRFVEAFKTPPVWKEYATAFA